MKTPVSPPPFGQLFDANAGEFSRLLRLRIGPEVRGKYEHWDHLRHLELFYFAITLRRMIHPGL